MLLNYTISHYVVLLADSIFAGLKIAVPLFFIIYVFAYEKWKSSIDVVVKSLVRLMILGGLLFVYTIVSNVFIAWSSGNEAERDMMLAFATGSHWHQFYFPLVNYAILPIVLWFRTPRSAIYIAISIVLVWYATGLYSDWIMNQEQTALGFRNKFDYQGYFTRIGLFLFLFFIFFGVEKWRCMNQNTSKFEKK